jgi:succinate dehydrogenase / fumarate reductase cytochrome b subunit
MATMSETTVSIDKPAASHWLSRLVGSSLGSKYVTAVTGWVLTGFVLVHMLGNLQIFLGRDQYNSYAQYLKSLGPVLWLLRGILLAAFLTHIAITLRLKKRNLDARPVRYVYERSKVASIPAQYMVVTGLLILLFIVFHLAHFTFGAIDRVDDKSRGETISYLDLKDPNWHDPLDPSRTRPDVYRMFIDGFRNVPISILYIVFMGILGLHLIHGVRSSFQSLGINNSKINHGLGLACTGLTFLIVAGNVFMPIAVMLGLIGKDVA